MNSDEKRWAQMHRWELSYDRSRLRGLSPEAKIRIFEEMREDVERLQPERLHRQISYTTPGDSCRDTHLADLLALKENLWKAYGRKLG